ncbi:hypothetical protein KIW84_071212 [Lathyrus oleraceus]|uniref:Uncharacterized protein n=1 Tax=Pisum sativum TaxID=3888 RepID=A0A9D4VIS9_PEA|nr:hypothetical protein KIW84_071212 [Pisum sativum]
MLLRYSSLASETITRHRGYRSSPHTKKQSLKRSFLISLNELEKLNLKLQKQHNCIQDEHYVQTLLALHGLEEPALDFIHKLIAYDHMEGDPGLDGGKNVPLFPNMLNVVCSCIDNSSPDITIFQVLKYFLRLWLLGNSEYMASLCWKSSEFAIILL